MRSNFDPIRLLRSEFSNDSKNSKIEGNMIIFGKKAKLELTTKTAWKPLGQSKIYSLGDLYIFLDNKRERQSNVEYMKKLKEYKANNQLQLISREHMKDIEE